MSRMDFDAGAHHEDGRAGEHGEVRGLVVALARAVAVHTAQSAGGEHPDSCPVCEERRPGHGRAAAGAGRDGHGKVPHAHLDHVVVVSQALDLLLAQADDRDAVDDTDRGRDDAEAADLLLGVQRHLDVRGPRQAVSEDRRLEGKDRRTLRHCGSNGFRDHHMGLGRRRQGVSYGSGRVVSQNSRALGRAHGPCCAVPTAQGRRHRLRGVSRLRRRGHSSWTTWSRPRGSPPQRLPHSPGTGECSSCRGGSVVPVPTTRRLAEVVEHHG